MFDEFFATLRQLSERGEPFATATVVRVEKPTSARVGDRAIVRGDGRLEGWVGGACAQPVVAREGLRALAEGQPRLIGLVGEGQPPELARRPGLTAYPMSCHSGGTIEIYIEPYLPQARVVVVGETPIARALIRLAAASEFQVATHVAAPADAGELGARDYVVVAAQGDDEAALASALRAEVAYVGLIASRRRAAALVAQLREEGLEEAALARLKAPAGLDIGASSPEEIALSVLAEIVQLRRRGHLAAPAPDETAAQPQGQRAPAPSVAVDPVCGMEVVVSAAQHAAEHQGTTYYFCCPGCRGRFVKNPGRFL